MQKSCYVSRNRGSKIFFLFQRIQRDIWKIKSLLIVKKMGIRKKQYTFKFPNLTYSYHYLHCCHLKHKVHFFLHQANGKLKAGLKMYFLSVWKRNKASLLLQTFSLQCDKAYLLFAFLKKILVLCGKYYASCKNTLSELDFTPNASIGVLNPMLPNLLPSEKSTTKSWLLEFPTPLYANCYHVLAKMGDLISTNLSKWLMYARNRTPLNCSQLRNFLLHACVWVIHWRNFLLINCSFEQRKASLSFLGSFV